MASGVIHSTKRPVPATFPTFSPAGASASRYIFPLASRRILMAAVPLMRVTAMILPPSGARRTRYVHVPGGGAFLSPPFLPPVASGAGTAPAAPMSTTGAVPSFRSTPVTARMGSPAADTATAFTCSSPAPPIQEAQTIFIGPELSGSTSLAGQVGPIASAAAAMITIIRPRHIFIEVPTISPRTGLPRVVPIGSPNARCRDYIGVLRMTKRAATFPPTSSRLQCGQPRSLTASCPSLPLKMAQHSMCPKTSA